MQGAVQINGNLQLYRGHAVWTNCTSFQNCTKNLPTANEQNQHEIEIYIFLPQKAKVLHTDPQGNHLKCFAFSIWIAQLQRVLGQWFSSSSEWRKSWKKMAKLGHCNIALFWPIFIFIYFRALQVIHDSLDIQFSEKK